MNIDRIRNLIQIEKNKYLSQYDNMDSFSKKFDMSQCNTDSAKRIEICKSIFALFAFIIMIYLTTNFSSLSKNEGIALLQILFYSIATMIVGTGTYSLLSMIFDKPYARKLYSQTKSEEEKMKLLEASLTNAFNKKEISNEIFNEIKVQLTKEEYIELRTQHPEEISYQDLKVFLNEKERLQKISDEQQNIILTPEQIKAYSSQNIKA